MVELKYAINNLDLENMSFDEKDEFFKTKNKFQTKIGNIECNFLDPIIYSKAWDFIFVKNAIGTCFNQKLLWYCHSFPGRVVDLEYCQKCKKVFWGCLKGHKEVYWEKTGYHNLYCEICRKTYTYSQISEYHSDKEKEFELEMKKKAIELDEQLRKTTFLN